MTSTTVSSGQTVSGLSVSAGDQLSVLSGGITSAAWINGGTSEIGYGGSSFAAILSGGSQQVDGFAARTSVASGGTQVRGRANPRHGRRVRRVRDGLWRRRLQHHGDERRPAARHRRLHGRDHGRGRRRPARPQPQQPQFHPDRYLHIRRERRVPGRFRQRDGGGNGPCRRRHRNRRGSGATTSRTTVGSGASLFVVPGGHAVSTTVLSGGTLVTTGIELLEASAWSWPKARPPPATRSATAWSSTS